MNRGSRICSPMPYHLAMAPSSERARSTTQPNSGFAVVRRLRIRSPVPPPKIKTRFDFVWGGDRPSVYKFLFLSEQKNWSGRRGSNSLPPPWQGGALPDELRPHSGASGRNRTNDTRIFSPLLYHLSYRGAFAVFPLVGTTGLEPVTPCL